MIHSENFKAPQKLPRVFIQFPINFRPDFDERERRYRERTAALHLWRERERECSTTSSLTRPFPDRSGSPSNAEARRKGLRSAMGRAGWLALKTNGASQVSFLPFDLSYATLVDSFFARAPPHKTEHAVRPWVQAGTAAVLLNSKYGSINVFLGLLPSGGGTSSAVEDIFECW